MQQESRSSGIVARLGRRVRRAVQNPGSTPTGPAQQAPAGQPAPGTVQPGSLEELRSLQEQVAAARADLQAADEERIRLKAERLELQEALGAQHGKRVLPRLKVEKTNGVASLVVGARMMQRVHARADDPAAGLDGAGSLLADAARTEAFVRSHGVQQPVRLGAAPTIVLHAFKGEVALVELRADGRVRHVTSDGDDPGDIRPAATYSAEIAVPDALDDLVAASRTLSAHLPRPYVQIGWTLLDGAPALTGMDVAPERVPVFDAEWDETLGKAFDAAHARMLMQPYRAGALDNRSPDGIFRYEESV